ncbi:S phase cyclin A-associated protein in the endoplasmic reticulum [Schistosoma japonicum]|nr:S phase cyclin A-associated protein in the endoplasmic reticulum [Schistosoma japonicum]KAH8857227.1 S phase cyclin A-associated protein in the endoplasmic reticulum [Schistosoma japonicum]
MSEGRCLGNVSQKMKCCDFSSWIKNKIENEGVQARNIIKYSVPVDNLCSPRSYFSKCDFNLSSEIDHEITKAEKNKITLPDDVNDNRGSLYSEVNNCNSSYDKSILGKDNFHKGRTVSNTRSSSLIAASSRTVCSEPHRRFGSATTVPYRQINRGRPLTESEYKARYWGQMLDTLRRTIDEIYSACETDENEVECKEVIMILEHSKQDFFSLIAKMNLLRDYEQADEQNRPNSLAWDKCTIFPGKPIMCQVLASTGVVTSAQQSYISLPLSIKSDSSVIEVADSDSDIGCCRSGSRSYLVDKHQLNTVIDVNKHYRHNDESCTIPPTNPNLCNLDNDPSDANDVEYEGEVELGEDEEEEERHHHEKQNMPSSFTYLVDDDADYIDQEDNTLSHDLEKLDKAVANVTTVERVLSHQLDRAQLAEASLRRRLIKEEKAAFVLSAGYNNQLWYKSRLKNTVNKSQHSEDVDTCDIVTATDDVEIDTDIDLLDMDSILMDDVDGSEKLLSGNMRKVTKGSNKPQHQQLTRIICSPLNFAQQSSQHRSNVGSNRIESNNKIIDDSSENHFHYEFFNCRCHRHNYTFNHHLSPIDFQCYKIDSQDKHLVSVERTHVQNSSNSVYMNKIENDVYEAKSPLDVGTCPHGLLLIPKTEAKSRIPGHGVHMHEKLSARSKRRSANSIEEIEEKQARARVLRQQHLLERTERVDEVHSQKRMLLHQRRSCLERRLHAAERKRQAELTRRVLKAHDEET